MVHLWAYQSQADREARRDALYADPAWQDYLREVMAMDFLVSWENKLLTPTWFSPDLGGNQPVVEGTGRRPISTHRRPAAMRITGGSTDV